MTFWLTCLNVSRLHGMLPKQLMLTGCWAWIRIVGSIFCRFLGNKYHSNWSIASLIAWNSLFIFSKTSQLIKTKTTEAISSMSGIMIRSQLIAPLDWKLISKRKRIISLPEVILDWTNKINLTMSIWPMSSAEHSVIMLHANKAVSIGWIMSVRSLKCLIRNWQH